MKKIFSLCLLSLILITSVGVNAIDKKTSEQFKKEKVNFWYNDRDLKHWVYYKDGEILKNDWMTNKNGEKYYFNEDGVAVTGWKSIDTNWYYFSPIGIMKTGWLKDNNNWYYLNTDGTMAHDTIINGYTLNSNGIWVK